MKMIEKLQKSFFEKSSADAALLISEPQRKYLSGFNSSDGYLLITKSAAYYLLDFRYAEAGRKAAHGKYEVLPLSSARKDLTDLVKREGIKSIALEYAGISLKTAMDLRESFKEIGTDTILDETLETEVKKLRMIKTPAEVEKIAKAQSITDKAFSEILNFIKPGKTEREIAAFLEYEMRVFGADGPSFETIVVSGENGSQCHGVPTDRKVREGDFLTMDFGALYEGYHADMTRTVGIGSLSDRQVSAYELVYNAQQAAIAMIREGVSCFDVDKAARDMIEGVYPGRFGHGLGHCVGVEIHEDPRFSPICHETLQENMVITVEPGVYLEGDFGLRIEDLVVVEKGGCRNLTESKKELILL